MIDLIDRLEALRAEYKMASRIACSDGHIGVNCKCTARVKRHIQTIEDAIKVMERNDD